MKNISLYFKNLTQAALISLFIVSSAQAMCDGTPSVLDQACQTVSDTWSKGDNDLYVPFHAYHMRYAYTQEKINSFRENTWGLGYGRSRYNDSGNWDGLYSMVFLDSHSKPEYILGYSHQWIWGEQEALHAGLGYTVLITGRSELFHYTPIPGILPVASINYGKAAINTAFVPGGKGNGNVLFFWARFGI